MRSRFRRLNLLGRLLVTVTVVLVAVVCLMSSTVALLGLVVVLTCWLAIILASDPSRRLLSGDDPASDADRLDNRKY
jgi:hypothetical protein